MKYLQIVVALAIAFVLGLSVRAKAEPDQMPRLSTERFDEIRTILKKTSYPTEQQVLAKRLSEGGPIKWSFSTARGKEPNRRHYTYYAIEPEIPYGGGFCVEMEVATRGEGPTDTVMAATLCFISRFGVIYYERPDN